MRMSDRMVREAVMDELNWHAQVCAVDIVASVDQGIVYLSGTVPSEAEKRLAEVTVGLVQGVLAVHSSLQVDACPVSKTHGPILRRLQAALNGLGFIDASAIQVRVEGGWVRLSGLIDSEEQRRYLVWLVQKTLGIREVSEALTLRG